MVSRNKARESVLRSKQNARKLDFLTKFAQKRKLTVNDLTPGQRLSILANLGAGFPLDRIALRHGIPLYLAEEIAAQERSHRR